MGCAEVRVEFEPRFCSNHVIDATAGCSFGCLYCPFSDLSARARGARKPTALALPSSEALPAPASVFLSPGSDPFTPQAAGITHDILCSLLPRGTKVGILTKGLIPERTLDLLAAYPSQVEGIGVGVTSLDEQRNRVLEPGCPPASERLTNLDRVASRGLVAALRIDPMFPELDDDRPSLERLLDEAKRRGANAVTATYVFAWGRYLRRLRKYPIVEPALAQLTEVAPMEGGSALSVPLSRKIATYSLLAELARQRALYFNTCGCKDLRVREVAAFPTSCRNPFFFQPPSSTRSGDCPESVGV
jgi:DNA repair photolyase